jgi:hypothetical protein
VGGIHNKIASSSEEYAASLEGLTINELWTQEELENFLKSPYPVLGSCRFTESESLHQIILHGYKNRQTFLIDPDTNNKTGYWDISTLWNLARAEEKYSSRKYRESIDPLSDVRNFPAFYGISGRPMYSGVYRLYQPRAIFTGYTCDPNYPEFRIDNYIGLQHYTTNIYEIEKMVNEGWDYEQAAFLDKGDQTLYRVYNPQDGNHHFTMNSYEKDDLVSRGWNDEGVGWRVASSGRPIYRIYNRGNGEHIYTLNYEEVKTAVEAGMEDEGIAWWS